MNAIFAAALDLQSFCDKHGWRCCFIGGLAVQRWGEPRMTRDADLTLLTGFGSEDAGHNAAAIYTLVEDCKAHDLPVEAYLKELLSVLPGVTDPKVVASLTPARIAAARRNKSARDDAA